MGKRVTSLVGFLLVACVTAAASPAPSFSVGLETTALRVGAVCQGAMAGCVISVYDSTASVPLVTDAVATVGDTVWATRACVVNEAVVIGATFVGTAPGKDNSAPVGARATGQCTATAEQPVPQIIVHVVP